jgi:hypothetical protein
MAAVAEALQTLAVNPQRLGGELGILAVLHTWGRKLNWHAHVHCLIPGVALRSDGSFAVVGTRFLVPVGAVRKVFPAILSRRFRAALPGFDPPGRAWRTPWNVLIHGFLAPGRRRDLRALQIALIARYAPSALAPEVPRTAAAAVPRPCPYCGSTRPRHCGTIPPWRPAVAYAVTWRAPPPQAS